LPTLRSIPFRCLFGWYRHSWLLCCLC